MFKGTNLLKHNYLLFLFYGCYCSVFNVAGVMCPRLANPDNGSVLGNGLTVGSRVTYFCDPEFSIRHSDVIFRECFSSGEWSGEEPLCIRELTVHSFYQLFLAVILYSLFFRLVY